MNGTVCAARQRFANHLRDPRRSTRADDDFAAVLFLEAQRFFERVRIRFVHLEAGIAFADPGLRVVQTRLPFARRNLFDADGNFHAWYLLNKRAPLVPPNPNEFESAYSISSGRTVFGKIGRAH